MSNQNNDLENFIEIDHLWLESIGFEVEHDGELTVDGWRGSYFVDSSHNSDGVFLRYCSPAGTWEIVRKVVNGTSGYTVISPLPEYDDGNDIIQLAYLLDIDLKVAS